MKNNFKRKWLIPTAITTLMIGGVFIQPQQKVGNQAAETHEIESFFSDGSVIEEEDYIAGKEETILLTETNELLESLKMDNVEKEKNVYINKKKADVFVYNEKTRDKDVSTKSLFTEGVLIAQNDKYAKVKFGEDEVFTENKNLSDDRFMVFREVEDGLVRYPMQNTSLFRYPSEKADRVPVNVNTELKLKGFNEKGFAKVELNGKTLYSKVNILSESKVVIPEKKPDPKPETNSTSQSKSNNNNNNNRNNTQKQSNSKNYSSSGKTVRGNFSAYYPENSKMQGGFHDALGNRLNPNNNTCAAPKSVPFGTKILVQNTGTHIDGQVFTVTDRGGAIKMQSDGTWRVDILMHNRSAAYAFGRRGGTITIVN